MAADFTVALHLTLSLTLLSSPVPSRFYPRLVAHAQWPANPFNNLRANQGHALKCLGLKCSPALVKRPRRAIVISNFPINVREGRCGLGNREYL